MGKVVAVIGASSDPRKFGNRAVRAFRRQGYTVVPINPNEAQVEGLKTYASVLDVPESIDMATFYVPPEVGEKVMPEVAQQEDSRSLAESGVGKRRADSAGALAEGRADRGLQHHRHWRESVRIRLSLDRVRAGSYTRRQ